MRQKLWIDDTCSYNAGSNRRCKQVLHEALVINLKYSPLLYCPPKNSPQHLSVKIFSCNNFAVCPYWSSRLERGETRFSLTANFRLRDDETIPSRSELGRDEVSLPRISLLVLSCFPLKIPL